MRCLGRRTSLADCFQKTTVTRASPAQLPVVEIIFCGMRTTPRAGQVSSHLPARRHGGEGWVNYDYIRLNDGTHRRDDIGESGMIGPLAGCSVFLVPTTCRHSLAADNGDRSR